MTDSADTDISFEALQQEQQTSSGTDVEDRANGGKKRDEWLKFTQKGQTLRAAFVYFHELSQVAASAAMKERKSKEEVVAAAKAALTGRADKLEKKPADLTRVERLHTDKSQFKMFNAHYQEGLGYVTSRLGLDGAEADKLWKKLPEPKKYFTTLLLVYPTDRDGNVNKPALKEAIEERKFAFLPYRFSGKTYDLIWNINDGLRSNDLEISSQDVIIECEDVQYQRAAIRPAGKAIYRMSEALMTAVLEQAVDKYGSLNPFRSMTTDELRTKLLGGGNSSGGGGGSPVSSTSFDDLLTGLKG